MVTVYLPSRHLLFFVVSQVFFGFSSVINLRLSSSSVCRHLVLDKDLPPRMPTNGFETPKSFEREGGGGSSTASVVGSLGYII